jgi:hypothetical protein
MAFQRLSSIHSGRIFIIIELEHLSVLNKSFTVNKKKRSLNKSSAKTLLHRLLFRFPVSGPTARSGQIQIPIQPMHAAFMSAYANASFAGQFGGFARELFGKTPLPASSGRASLVRIWSTMSKYVRQGRFLRAFHTRLGRRSSPALSLPSVRQRLSLNRGQFHA